MKKFYKFLAIAFVLCNTSGTLFGNNNLAEKMGRDADLKYRNIRRKISQSSRPVTLSNVTSYSYDTSKPNSTIQDTNHEDCITYREHCMRYLVKYLGDWYALLSNIKFLNDEVTVDYLYENFLSCLKDSSMLESIKDKQIYISSKEEEDEFKEIDSKIDAIINSSQNYFDRLTIVVAKSNPACIYTSVSRQNILLITVDYMQQIIRNIITNSKFVNIREFINDNMNILPKRYQNRIDNVLNIIDFFTQICDKDIDHNLLQEVNRHFYKK